jgi:hypothetical protein
LTCYDALIMFHQEALPHLSLLIVLVVLAAGEWKEHGFVVQAGRRMAYKGTN